MSCWAKHSSPRHINILYTGVESENTLSKLLHPNTFDYVVYANWSHIHLSWKLYSLIMKKLIFVLSSRYYWQQANSEHFILHKYSQKINEKHCVLKITIAMVECSVIKVDCHNTENRTSWTEETQKVLWWHIYSELKIFIGM